MALVQAPALAPRADVPGSPADERSMRARFTLDAVARLSWWVFGAQFVLTAAWTELLYSRYSVTWDGAIYLQAAYLIAHGHLDPSSSALGHAFWQDHSSFAYWPLALLELLDPHGLTILWTQDLAAVAAGAGAFRWIVRILRTAPALSGTRWPALLAGAGLLMLVVNPWTYWALSFDIHLEVFATLFIVAAASDFSDGRMARAWVWVALTLLCGDVAGSWIVGLGISAGIAALVNPARRRQLAFHAALLAGVGVAWAAVITAISGNRGSNLTEGYSYLVASPGSPGPRHLGLGGLVRGALTHPGRVAAHLWSQKVNVAANVGPTGWVGIFTPWSIGVPAVIFIENGLRGGAQFTVPLFQSLPVYTLSAVGTITILAWFVPRSTHRILVAAVALLVVNALAWSAVWLPQMPGQWLRVSAVQSAALVRIQALIPETSEVVASQGIQGRFADRSDIQLASTTDIPVSGSDVWFVIAPNAGIEVMPVNAAMGAITELAGPMHATLVSSTAGIWAFEWARPPGVHSVSFSSSPQTIGGWTASSQSGVPVTVGPVQNWHVSADGRAGYVLAQDYWTLARGEYEIGVSLSAGTPVIIEVSNAANNDVLARRQVPGTNGIEEQTIALDLSARYPRRPGYGGWGPFALQPIAPDLPGDNVIEVRVWSPAGGQVSAYSVSVVPEKVPAP